MHNVRIVFLTHVWVKYGQTKSCLEYEYNMLGSFNPWETTAQNNLQLNNEFCPYFIQPCVKSSEFIGGQQTKIAKIIYFS